MDGEQRNTTGSIGMNAEQGWRRYAQRTCRLEASPSRELLDPSVPDAHFEKWVDWAHQVGVEVCVIGEVGQQRPRFRSKMLPPHPDLDRDRLPFFLELVHRREILVLYYVPLNRCAPLREIHPEWQMKFLDTGDAPMGDPPKVLEMGWFCFSSPFRDWLPEHFIEHLDNLDLDGFYISPSNWGSHYNRPHYPACCCSYCEQLYRRETGRQIPAKVDFDSIDFKRFVNWRYHKYREFVRHVFGRVREKHPAAILDMNFYNRPSSDWSDAHPLNPLPFKDVGGHLMVETFRSLREPGFESKLLRATGTPFSVWRGQEHRSFMNAEPCSSAIAGFSALANGGTICGNLFGPPHWLQTEVMTAVFGEFKKRRDYIEGETVKYVGLHYSQQNRDFRPSEIPKNTGNTNFHEIGMVDAYGAYEILNRSHLLLDLVFDEHLTHEHLSKYPVLFLSNSACLSDGQCGLLTDYVREGGTLVATHETSLLDEWGQERDNFALAALFGVDYQGPRHDGDDRGVTYLTREEELQHLFGPLICFYGKETQVSLRNDREVQVLCTRSSLEGEDSVRDFHPAQNHDSGEPAVVSHEYGQGRAIYLAADVGGAFMSSPYPLLRRFVAHLVARTQAPIAFQAPEAIEATAAWRGPGELMVHLLNNPTPLLPWRVVDRNRYDEEMTSFHALREVNPIYDVEIRFNGFEVKAARLPLRDKSLHVTGGDPATVVVPEVELHEVLLLEVNR